MIALNSIGDQSHELCGYASESREEEAIMRLFQRAHFHASFRTILSSAAIALGFVGTTWIATSSSQASDAPQGASSTALHHPSLTATQIASTLRVQFGFFRVTSDSLSDRWSTRGLMRNEMTGATANRLSICFAQEFLGSTANEKANLEIHRIVLEASFDPTTGAAQSKILRGAFRVPEANACVTEALRGIAWNELGLNEAATVRFPVVFDRVHGFMKYDLGGPTVDPRDDAKNSLLAEQNHRFHFEQGQGCIYPANECRGLRLR